MEQQVVGDVIVTLAMNQSDPAYMASILAMPRDFVQAILCVTGEVLLLLG